MRILLVFLFVLSLGFGASAQQFSKDKVKFRTQVISKIKSRGTESAFKIASDFQNAWDTKFTTEQQEKIHLIALEMQKRGLPQYPTFYHFFTYLAYSVSQEGINRDQLDKVLKINTQVVQTLNKKEYQEFVFGLNIFFGRRYLSYDKNLAVQAVEGSYEFKELEGVTDDLEMEEETVEEDTVSIIAEDEMPEIIEDDGGWGSSNDPWDTSNDDPWGSTDDSWGNDDDWGSDDGWGDSDDSWGSEPEEAPAAAKPKAPSFSPSYVNYLATKQSQYREPQIDGPVLELKNTRIVMATPFDSIRIKNVNASFLLKNRGLIGTQGSIDWPARQERFSDATIQLKNFYIEKDHTNFWTPNASLSYETLIGTESVEGVFEFEGRSNSKRASRYPVFTSNNAGIKVDLGDDRLTYEGGIQLRGNQLWGKSVSREEGTLKVLDGKGRTVILKSKEFLLNPNKVSMEVGTVTILHDSDSITHLNVRAKYDKEGKKLMILRNEATLPFSSSYFEVDMGIDQITWFMETDSLALEIVNARGLLPATFRSTDFFNFARYQKFGRFLNFHPINATVYYAQKYGVEQMYVGELALEYNINEKEAMSAAKILKMYGFADYDPATGLIVLKKKAFHYYAASGNKTDFDNLMIPSKIKNGPNAHLLLDSGQLKIKGVSRFYLTTSFKVYAEPADSTFTLLKGRDFELDGMVHAGDFQYKGSGHQFDYDQFLFEMPQIDSMRLTVPLRDSTGVAQTALKNEIQETSGTLYIDKSDNRSGKIKNNSYPYFVSQSDATVYFDSPEILDGAYDRSVKFIVPPFELDSLERDDGTSIKFGGTFNSGGIFPAFEDTLSIQPDQSLGFIHKMPEAGYNLYGTEARTYEEIRLSNQGMRGFGKIDFLTTTIYSDDFIYYPDSVTTDGTSGVISPGTYKGASYPEAILGQYDMYWLPRKDSMYLRTVNDPFKFYNATAELDGEVNITTKGVYGGGTMKSRGSKAVSSELTFSEIAYGARHANFEILTDNPEKPAMAGDDIRLSFDLTTNTATVRPERVGVAAISFPYAQMKTSITEAVWDLEDSIVTMTKPELVPIKESYFFTTRTDLDSLAFNAEKAVYDINSQELNITGIPYIIVADSKIIPEGNETTILANSVLQQFKNAEIIIDTLNSFHYLDKANIRIFSRNKFEGTAYYKQIVGIDTFDIRFDSFELESVPVGKPNRKGKYQERLMTVSGGVVEEQQNLIMSPGFTYKGDVTMYASKPALELDGYVKLMLSDPSYNHWVAFNRTEGEKDVAFDISNAVFESGQKVQAGIYTDDNRDEMYSIFAEPKKDASDLAFFEAKGQVTFIDSIQTYRIEESAKTAASSYAGYSLFYSDSTKGVLFDGKVQFINPGNEQLQIAATGIGSGSMETNEYTVNSMLSITLPAPSSVMDVMADDLIDIIQRVGSPAANDISDINLLYKLANITSNEIAKEFEEESLKEYVPLVEMDGSLESSMFISGVKMVYDPSRKTWHNTTKIGLSSILDEDVNAKLDGFLEFSRDDTGADKMSLFIQAAPGVWYYVGYSVNELILYSSNGKFNDEVRSKSNEEKPKPGELILRIGEQNETLGFINAFRKEYFGIDEPYNLVLPDDATLEDEEFKTIEEDDEDDGFGF